MNVKIRKKLQCITNVYTLHFHAGNLDDFGWDQFIINMNQDFISH